MTVFADVTVYRTNPLMNANLFFRGAVLLIFGLFNVIFLGGFFRTAYKIGKPLIVYIIAAFLAIGIAEAAHHFSGMEALNVFGLDHIVLQMILLLSGVLLYVLTTVMSYRKAFRNHI